MGSPSEDRRPRPPERRFSIWNWLILLAVVGVLGAGVITLVNLSQEPEPNPCGDSRPSAGEDVSAACRDFLEWDREN